MTFTGKQKLVIFGIITMAIVLADQASKSLILSSIKVDDGFSVIPGFFNIVHARNPGAAFGIFSDSFSGFRSLFFITVSVIALVTICVLVARSREVEWSLLMGYVCFFGGALGNLIDRIRFGEVVDFLDFHIRGFHWPAFNVADASLCVGIGFFFIHLLSAKE